MQVVINKCYGGFGLSKAALLEIACTSCIHYDLMHPKEYFGAGWEKLLAEAVAKPDDSIFRVTMFNDRVLVDNHASESARACPYLVEVVTRLGDKANGRFSDLKVVEIPDDIEYEINDYDGRESIHEVHKTWG